MNSNPLPPSAESRALYNAALIRGKQLYNELESFNLQDQIELGKLDELYDVEVGPARPPSDGKLKSAFEDLGVSADRLNYYEVSTKTKKAYRNPAYIGNVSSRDGVIQCIESYKEKDHNSPAMRLFCSQIVWQAYQMDADVQGQSASKLRLIFQDNVINADTLNAIWWSAEISGHTGSKRNGHTIYELVDDGFYAILGSMLGKQVMRMLIEKKNEIGYRTVDRVVVLGLDDKHTIIDLYNVQKHRTFYIQLSERRTPSDGQC